MGRKMGQAVVDVCQRADMVRKVARWRSTGVIKG